MSVQGHSYCQSPPAKQNTCGPDKPVEDLSTSPVSRFSLSDLIHSPSFHANADGFNFASPDQTKSLASGSRPQLPAGCLHTYASGPAHHGLNRIARLILWDVDAFSFKEQILSSYLKEEGFVAGLCVG